MPLNLLRKRRRVFPVKALEKYYAKLITLRKDEILITEGDPARDYYQVESGSVKMYSANQDGQEFIQGIFNPGESFARLQANPKAWLVDVRTLPEWQFVGLPAVVVQEGGYHLPTLGGLVTAYLGGHGDRPG